MTEPVSVADVPGPRAASWAKIASSLAGYVATDGFARGDLAALRRINPDGPDAAVFWRLMSRHNLLGSPDVERRWALILHGIALMTRTAGAEPSSRTAHDRNVPVGKALFQGGEPERIRPFYSESRLNRLLTARGSVRRALLARTFRMLGSAGQRIDWREMACLILNDGNNAAGFEDARRRIARAYYSAEHQAQRRQASDSSS